MMRYADYLTFAHQLADTARTITLSYFRTTLAADCKIDGSPVTVADQQTEQTLREMIAAQYPSHGIIGEEQSAKAAQSEFEWIIDPIDGTKNFVAGLPLFGALICLLENGKPVVSVIDIPAQNERWSASCETETRYHKGDELVVAKTRSTNQLAAAVLCSTDYSMFTAEEHRQVTSLREAVNIIRYNGDCYLYGMLSSGWIDIVLESDLKVYDFLPLVLIVEQAGGFMTDWQGQPLTKQSRGQVIACANRVLHQAALSQLQR